MKTEYHHGCIHEIFELQAEQSPDAVALVFEGVLVTYGELQRASNQLARYLRSRGVDVGTPVAICTDRSIEMIVGLLGILKAGGAYVPLEPGNPASRLSFILEDTGASIILTQEHLLQKGHFDRWLDKAFCLDADWKVIAKEKNDSLHIASFPNDLAYIMYTSGSTGQPKGVCIPHRGVVRLCRNADFVTLSASDVFLALAPFSFDASTFEIWGCLLNGGRLAIMPPQQPSLEELGRALRTYGVTTLWLTAGLFHLMVSERLEDMAGLRQLLAGGDVLSVSHVRRAAEALPQCRLINGYGPTENTTFTCCHTVGDPSLLGDNVPIGYPISGTQVYVLDENLAPVPDGVPGELYAGGAGLALGYLNRPELTQERFIRNPFSADSNERLYKTGDLVRRRENGMIEFIGRLDQQIKIRGFRIELGEIEATLERHPDVRHAVVIVRADIHGEKSLVAYIVPRRAPARDSIDCDNTSIFMPPDLLRKYLGIHLPDYMVPSHFVLLDALPLTQNGKVDRAALPKPATNQRNLDSSFIAPRTPMEHVLSVLWADALGLSEVGVLDHFFELGGHSILAAQILSRLRDRLHINISLRTFFEAPTLGQFAEAVDAHRKAEKRPNASIIPPAPRGRMLPLSSAQRRLWFLAKLEPDSPVYNECITLQIKGTLDTEAFLHSLRVIFERHEAWRTTFDGKDGEPMQIIHPEMTIEVPVIDLSMHPFPESEAEALRIAREDVLSPFELETGPMARAVLIHLREDEHRLYMTLHHILVDGVSLYNIILPELAELYTAYSTGREPKLNPLSLQYADFSVWEQEWLRGSEFEAQLAWWKRELSGELPMLLLPTDRPRQSTQSPRGSRQLVAISSEQTRALKALAQREGATLFMTVLAVFNALLYRTSGQEEFMVGTAMANRSRAGTENLVGLMVNMVVLRSNLRGDPTFRELLARTVETTLGAYSNQNVPFERVVEEIQPSRTPGQNPLFQVALVLEPPLLELPSGWHMSQLEVDSFTSKFELMLELDERPEGLIGRLEYRADLFDAATIARMAGHLQVLLESILATPDRRISELPFMTEAELQEQVRWNDTYVDYTNERCIHHMFELQAAQSPSAKALVAYGARSPKTPWTYGQLNRRANQLAHYLRELGVGPEVMVAIRAQRSPELVLGLLGILKAGGACVPLDPSFPKERTAFVLQDVGAKILLTQQHLEDVPYEGQVIYLDECWLDLEAYDSENPVGEIAQNALAYVLYTSGSTGRPKGALLEHRSLISFICWYRRTFALSPLDRGTMIAGPAFDASIADIWPILTSGGSIHIPDDNTRLLPAALRDWMVAASCTISFLSTPLAENILSLPWPRSASLRTLITGGDRLHDYPSPSIPFALCNVYGPTETTVFATTAFIPPQVNGGEPPPIGTPVDNTRIFLLDRHLHPVPVGVPGEIYIAGDGLARGYLNRPELTAERFIACPPWLEPGGRLYKTGDLARYLPSGSIAFLGRTDFQVKIRGFRVEIGEIEAILRQHCTVKEAVVMVHEDAQNGKRLVAYVILHDNEQLGAPPRLREHLKAFLPDPMIPAAFVQLSAFPLNPSGKIDRHALRALELAQTRPQEHRVEAASHMERLIASVWRDVLQLDIIGLDDNFFDIGGHSLLIAQIHDKLIKALGREISLIDLFAYPTVSALASYLNNQEEAPDSFTDIRERVNLQQAAARRFSTKSRERGTAS